jgi:hypothetical protein
MRFSILLLAFLTLVVTSTISSREEAARVAVVAIKPTQVPYLDTLNFFEEEVCYHENDTADSMAMYAEGYYYPCKGGNMETVYLVPGDNQFSIPCRFLVVGLKAPIGCFQPDLHKKVNG